MTARIAHPLRHDPNSLGGQVYARRRAAGLSLGELARLTGASKGYLSQIETGQARRPGAHVVQRIARALGCSMDDLLGVPEAIR